MLRTIVLPLMTPPLVAGIALCFVSCLGNFGIPAFLGIPGQLPGAADADLPAARGPRPERAVRGRRAVGADRLHRRARHLAAGPDAAPARFSHHARHRARCAPFELARWRLPVEIALWTLSIVVLVLPLVALLLTLAGARGRRAADGADRRPRELRLRAVRARRREARVRQQLQPVGDRCHRHRADRRSARVFPGLAPLAAAARAQPGHRDAVRAARRRARDRRDPALPEAAAGARAHRSTTPSGSSCSAISRASWCWACVR